MKRKFTILILFSFLPIFLYGQRNISGTIYTENGDPLIGANIIEKDRPTNGTSTDIDGNFNIVVHDVATLVISYIGFIEKEIAIGPEDNLYIVLQEGVQFSEVIVTALGISRESKSLGYAAQEVDGENLSLTREANVVSSLAGKVAGVQVTSASGASLGGSANIRIRGSNGLTGGRPLFVVDGTPISNANFSASTIGTDFGNLASDINPDDIDKITVLKGPSATALYGNRAANGVVLITTKKGQKQRGLGISINSSITSQNVYLTPSYQNEFAGGYEQQFQQFTDPVDGQTYNVLEYYADESWGPKMDGTLYRPWWSWYPGENYGQQIPLEAHPNNVKDFFDTGITFNNNISISSSNDKAAIRVSFTNINQDGVMPNSSLDRNNLNVSSSLNLSEKFKVSTNLNFVSINGKGRPEFGYAANNPVSSFNQWFQRQLDMDRLRDYETPDGTFSSWNIRSPVNLRPLYWDSPFFSVMENYSTDSRDRYFGNITASYVINDQLSVEGSIRKDQYTNRIERRTASGGLEEASYSESVVDGAENNYDFLIKYKRNTQDISWDAFVGGALRTTKYHSNFGATVGGLSAPNLYTLGASVDRPRQSSFISEKKVRSLYTALNLGYKGIIYLGGTLRNDWSSALPDHDNSYLYSSINGSFIFSELFKSELLSYGKIRASYAQVGSDLNPYRTISTYNTSTPFGSLPAFFVPGTLINEDIRPALSESMEFGLEMRFLKNRFGIDVTYYKENNKDQILTLQIPGSTGYSSAIINAGNIQDEGVELSLKGSPISSPKFSWDIIFNMARNHSKVLELAEGLDNRLLGYGGFGGFSMNAPVGGDWGMMRGTAILKTDDGKPVINEWGFYETVRDQDLGTFMPDYTGGVINSFRLFGIEIGTFIDFQIGGQFLSLTEMLVAYSGLSTETVGLNDKGNPIRIPVSEGGGIRVDGALLDGTEHTVYMSPEFHFKGMFNLHERWIYDASYIKLREISVGYPLPRKWIDQLPINDASISLVAHNVWLIHSKVNGIDPSELSPGSNRYGYQETGILPGVRSIGINLKVGF